jgi:hypothetical protein
VQHPDLLDVAMLLVVMTVTARGAFVIPGPGISVPIPYASHNQLKT